MKKLLLGLLTLAIITLTLTSCQQPTAAAYTGSAPQDVEAFFIKTSELESSMTWNQAIAKRQTTLTKSIDYKLCVWWKDLDKNTTKLQISPNAGFNSVWQWEFTLNNPERQETGIWSAFTITFAGSSAKAVETRNFFANQTASPYYVRLVDSMGNISAVYTIQSLTITN